MLSRCVASQLKQNSYFLVGVALGLWLALLAVPLDEPTPCPERAPLAAADEFEPHREARPLGAAPPPAGRSVQRPRYYSTELGMRAPLLAGALSSEAALDGRAAALNATAGRLQPGLRFFIAASALGSAPARPNVVGFTDSREMLRPFHALKYLADNYLEEYEFFFLVSDASYVNARRLAELAGALAAGQRVYMGAPADEDSHYCSLEGGILLSNSVLRAVHSELDWCVRNSYSPHHHENLGRCVLHAAHVGCVQQLQGQSYGSLRLRGEGVRGGLVPALADVVTARPLTDPRDFYTLHAYVSRVYLQRTRAALTRLRSSLWVGARRHPPGYRNASWPAGLRADPGLAPPSPESRFDHLRWTLFNATHALMPDEQRAAAPLSAPHASALALVLGETAAWARLRWPEAGAPTLLEGAWRYEPATALRYRLVLRVGGVARALEVARPLGAARLVPVPYVTESARVAVVVRAAAGAAPAALRRYEAACLERGANTQLVLVLSRADNDTAEAEAARALAVEIRARHPASSLDVLEAPGAEPGEERAALAAALPRLARDGLVLLLPPDFDYNEDFLNRVRMNTILGEQWYLPVPFARFAQYVHPRFLDADGRKPQVNTGRFSAAPADVLAFYRRDYDSAAGEWRGGSALGAASVLAGSPLRCVRAPEPGLVRAPRAAPPTGPQARALRAHDFAGLELGARHALARMMLEMEAERAR